MSGYKTIAVIGAVNLGLSIVEELVKIKEKGIIDEVIQLSRSADVYEKTEKLGVKLRVVDYNDYKRLVQALRDVDAVVSTVNGEVAFKQQQEVIRAAQEAGVKLFVPSEFGNPNEDRKDWIFALKDSARLKQKEIGLPYAIFYTGPFSDFIFVERLGFDFKGQKVTIGGDGNKLVSFTNRRDIARFVAHALTALPREQIEWKTFRIEGERTTFNDVVRQWEERTGKKIDVTHIPRTDLEKKSEENPNDLTSRIWLDWDNGNGVTAKKQEELDNKIWPEWKPLGVIDTLLGKLWP